MPLASFRQLFPAVSVSLFDMSVINFARSNFEQLRLLSGNTLGNRQTFGIITC